MNSSKLQETSGPRTVIPSIAGNLQPQEGCASLFDAGMEAQKRGDFAVAIGNYEAALQRGFTSFDLFFNLGLCLDKTNELDAAIIAFQTAAELFPQNRPTLLHLVSLHMEKGDKEASLKYWAKYEQLH